MGFLTRETKGKRFLVAGHIAKDVHIKILDSNGLPGEFRRLFKDSTPVSRVSETLGSSWNFNNVLNLLKKHAISPVSYSYGGRGPNVAYGAAKLGAAVELIGFVGEDFDKRYPGFYEGGYRTHLRKAGITIREMRLDPADLATLDESTHNHGVLAFNGREIPSVYCVKDVAGNDFYFIDDIKGAQTLAPRSPVPKRLVDEYDGLFVTSGEITFNTRLIEYASDRGKEVIFDIAAYGTTDSYLRKVVPRCNIILGNSFEIGLVTRAFQLDSIGQIFERSTNLGRVVVEDKISCTAMLFKRSLRGPLKIGPAQVERRVSSVGCCDGMAAGYLALYAQGYDETTALHAGLLEAASVWTREGVQEGMLNKEQLEMKLGKL
ncbi:MAG: carbohydrate kinase family protein [Nitrososphaeria archaeon]